TSTPGEREIDLLDRVSALVEQSLLRRSDNANDEPRFAMLETLREFGLEQLAASGEATTLGQAHAAWFLDFAERAAAGLQLVADAALLDSLEAEQGNLRAALRWLIDHEAADASLRLAVAVEPLWFTRGQASEG